MSDDSDNDSGILKYAPDWLSRFGVTSWLVVGVLVVAGAALSAVGTLGSLLTPLVAALILAVLFQPVVTVLANRGVPRTLAALAAMLLVLVMLVGLLWVVIGGFVQWVPEIGDQLSAGWHAIRDWLVSLELETEWIDSLRTKVQQALPSLGLGLAGWLGSTVTSIVGLFIGLYFGVYVLFYLLRDSAVFISWATRNSQIRPDLVGDVFSDAARSIRGYFRGTALTAAITAAIVAIPLIVLDVPLVIPILVLYFFTSFIPYLGAFVAGAFAVIIALGSGGAETAFIVLIAVIISNGGIQTAINNWALGTSLNLHPLAVLLATTVGGAVAGVAGMILGAPALALAVQVTTRLREYHAEISDESPDTQPTT
jgi:predicted PurR-regulated permease PerM